MLEAHSQNVTAGGGTRYKELDFQSPTETHKPMVDVRTLQKPAEKVVPRSMFEVGADPVPGSKEGGSHNWTGLDSLPHKYCCDNKYDWILILMHLLWNSQRFF